ncbi:GspE/PulE family protein [Chitinimonas lacunae]|uniref:GspE/PulE family protein n=1 Tax=Chitinimonas lacunae TaxID=1963018 RepID=A0ABV8MXK6_9NEIS
MPRPEKIRLGDLLQQQGMLSEAQLAAALAQQKQSGAKLGRILVDTGLVTEEQISQAIARQLQIPFIDLRAINPSAKTVSLLPEAAARRYRALVLEERSDGLLVGMADPSDLFAYDEIARLLKRDLLLAAITEGQLLAAIDRLYRKTEAMQGLARELERDLGNAYVDIGQTATGAEDAPVVKLLQSMFEDAMQVRASDIHIEPQENRLAIRFRIDGTIHLQTESDSRIAPAVVLRLKLMSGLDISEKRLPQDGRFNVKLAGRSVDMRISTMPTQYGESVVMRVLAQNAGLLDLDRIGMPEPILAGLRRAIDRPHGLVLVTGPTGSGKTTTLYAALKELSSPHNKIITVEDPVEYRLPGLNQVQVNEKIDLSFARVLRAALRQDPDIILVGEMRDEETAQIGIRAAMTGHLVLSTLHTNDAISTPVRLVDMGVPKFLLASALLGVMAQRLVRMLCPICAIDAPPDPREMAWLESTLGERAASGRYRMARGCQTCNNTGYSGRAGVYEYLEMNAQLVEALNRGEIGDFPLRARERLGRHTLRHHAAERAWSGDTTPTEAMRVALESEE